MEQSNFSKLGCCLTLGLLLPPGAAQAWDGSDIQEPSFVEEILAAPPAAGHPSPTAHGALGPIRTDLSEDKPVGKKVSTKKEDAKVKNFAYPDEDRNFRYAEGG